MMYIFPLIVIVYSYVSILLEIFRRTRTTVGGTYKRIVWGGGDNIREF